jgi:hypothetical protein
MFASACVDRPAPPLLKRRRHGGGGVRRQLRREVGKPALDRDHAAALEAIHQLRQVLRLLADLGQRSTGVISVQRRIAAGS